MSRRGRILLVWGCLYLLVACSTPEQTAAGSEPGNPTQTTGSNATVDPASPTPEGCSPSEEGVAWREDDSVTLAEIGGEGGVTIYAAEYPLPGPTEGLWSQWGQGIALGDGRHLSAVGDHEGRDANSYFFHYDHANRSLTRIGDVLSIVPHEEGAFGYGKIHAQMVGDGCGSVWAASYWGTREDLVYENGYEGDRLFEIDPAGRTITDRGAVAGEHGIPTMTIANDGRTLIAGSVDPATDDPDRGLLTVYDTVLRETLTQVDDPRQEGFRALGTDPESGRVFYSIGNSQLAALDPESGEFEDLELTMPGLWLRAVTPVAPDGTVYAAADDGPALFSMTPDGALTNLGELNGITTSLAMTPDGSRIFWLPGAHGAAPELGANIMALDTASGEMTEVISLLEPFEDGLSLRPGGTYSIVYDEGRLILGVNASTLDDDSGFGTVVLVVVEGV